MRRAVLIGIAGTLALTSLVALGGYFIDRPTVLRVAVGPPDSADFQLITAAGQVLARTRNPIHFKIVPRDGARSSATAIDDGEADLAVLRSDISIPTNAKTMLILHRNALIIAAPFGSGIKRIEDLSGRRVGMVGGGPGNDRLLATVLAQAEVEAASVRMTPLPVGDIATAVMDKRVDAILTVGIPSDQAVADIVATVTRAAGGPPVIVPIDEADAIAQRVAAIDSFEIVRGAFGGSPPRPAESVSTIGVSYRLVALDDIKDSTIGSLTEFFLAQRAALAALVPLASKIEAPSTAKGSGLPVHSGAVAYLDDDEETFLDRYSDFIYIGAMVLSVLGSSIAALASRVASQQHLAVEGLTRRLLDVLAAVRTTQTSAGLDVLEGEMDAVLTEALSATSIRSLEGHRASAFSLALDQLRAAIGDRRRVIEARASALDRPLAING